MRLAWMFLLLLLIPSIALPNVIFSVNPEIHGTKVKACANIVHTGALRRQMQDIYSLMYSIRNTGYHRSFGGFAQHR